MWRWLLLVDPRVFWAPGRPWRRAAPWAARRQAVRAASFDRRVGSLSCQALPPRAPQPACTAAQPSDLSGTAARPCGPSGALRAGGAFAADVARRVALIPSYGCQPPIPHVIPRRLIQTLNLHRWNCNVFGASLKMTAMNYVRNLDGGGVGAARFGRPRRELRSALRLVVRPGPAAHGCRSQALWFLRCRGLALSAMWPGCLKPSSPLLAGVCVGLKPPSPLRVRNGRFWCIFHAQR